MAKRFAQIVGILVFAAGLIGLFSGEGQLAGFINIDLTFDLLRMVFGALLIYAGFAAPVDTARTIVKVVGGIYVLMGIVGLFSPDMLGLLPGQLTGFDIVFHLLGGALGAVLALMSEKNNSAAHAA